MYRFSDRSVLAADRIPIIISRQYCTVTENSELAGPAARSVDQATMCGDEESYVPTYLKHLFYKDVFYSYKYMQKHY
jgi:hypothetical protein